MITSRLPPRHAAITPRRRYFWITELFKYTTIRRNMVALSAGISTSLATPWLFLAAFNWLTTEGVTSTPLEVIALANRNQTPAFLLMITLGLQAYLSDASNGILLSELAESQRNFRCGPATAKLLFGIASATFLAAIITVSNISGWWTAGSGALTPAQQAGLWSFWLVSFAALFTALIMNYLFGLLAAVFFRTKGLSTAVGIALPWILGTVVMPALRTALPSVANVATLVLPTELTSTLSSWTPGGNAILSAPMDSLTLRAVITLLWLVAGASTWILLIQHRALYPADQG